MPNGKACHQRRITLASWVWFGCWLVVGAGLVIGAFTIWFVVLPVTVAFSILLAVLRRQSLLGLPGIVSGLGLPLLYVAYLNRAGPGYFCTSTGRGSTCGQHPSPWPWLIIRPVLVIVGLGFLGRMVVGPITGSTDRKWPRRR